MQTIGGESFAGTRECSQVPSRKCGTSLRANRAQLGNWPLSRYPIPRFRESGCRIAHSVIAVRRRMSRPMSKRNLAVWTSDGLFFLCRKIDQQRRDSAVVQHADARRIRGLRRLLPLPWAKTTKSVAREGGAMSGGEFCLTCGQGDFSAFNAAYAEHSGGSPGSPARPAGKTIPVRR